MNEFNRRYALAGGRLLAAATSLGFGRADAAQARVPPGDGPLQGHRRHHAQSRRCRHGGGRRRNRDTRRGIVCEDSFGKANVATGSPMTPDLVFWLPSMTKAFTAMSPFMATSGAASTPASAKREWSLHLDIGE
jgi:methyl acetate hydrolase